MLRPVDERLGVGRGHRGIPVDADDLLHGDAQRPGAEHRVGDGCDGRHHLAQQHGVADHHVPHRHVVGLHHRSGHRVQLGDVDTLRAAEGADATAGAVIQRLVDRFPMPEPFGLRADVLGAREQRCHGGHRALGLADGALDTLVQAHSVELLGGIHVGGRPFDHGLGGMPVLLGDDPQTPRPVGRPAGLLLFAGLLVLAVHC